MIREVCTKYIYDKCPVLVGIGESCQVVVPSLLFSLDIMFLSLTIINSYLKVWHRDGWPCKKLVRGSSRCSNIGLGELWVQQYWSGGAVGAAKLVRGSSRCSKIGVGELQVQQNWFRETMCTAY